MLRLLTLLLCCLILLPGRSLAGDYTEEQGRAAWGRLKTQPVTESNFRAVCDLLQDIGRSNINLSYEILAEYVPMVQKTGNKDRVHILLMAWAKAKESLIYFEDAEKLYARARDNAVGNPRHYDEALVGTLLLYAEWGRPDSAAKYAALGRQAAEGADDRENLSFIYTFSSTMNQTDTAVMRVSLQKAIQLAEGLADKNALFTARYNYATFYCRYSPQLQVEELDKLLPLTTDPSLDHKPKLYERSAFYFRNPASNIYMQLMQVNIMLADYDNAWKFGELLYDAVVKPNPSAPQAAYFNTELAMVKAYQQDFPAAKEYLDQSLRLFKVPEEKIPYPSYFLAAGMMAEKEGRGDQALQYYEHAWKMGPMEGLHLMPSDLYYAHALILVRRLGDAERVLAGLRPALAARFYSSYGFYYYKHFADLQKAKGDYAGYARALDTYYIIRDSLVNFRQYRAVREIEERMRVRDKERQIVQLHQEESVRKHTMQRERVYFSVSLLLALLAGVLLVAFARNRIRQMAKQHQIDILQGAIEVEARERRKVADQLHDEVGGMLSLAILNVSSTIEQGGTKGSEPRLEKAQEILVSVSTTIRELSHRLTPLDIEKLGFRRAVENMIEAVNLSGKLKVEGIITGFEDSGKYDVPFLNDLYRMLQELLHNILKHAGADHAFLELTEHEGLVSVLVEDDGVGIGANTGTAGKGLDAMRLKVAYLNGRIEISRQREGGTLVVMELPYHKGRKP